MHMYIVSIRPTYCLPFRCKRGYELGRHTRTKHDSASAALKCGRCEYRTASRQHLRRHEATHDKGKGKELRCRYQYSHYENTV